MQVVIRSLTSKKCVFQVEPSTTVLSLKQRYQDKEGPPPDRISLIFAGKELENHVTVSDLNLEDGSILFVSLPIFADRRRNDSRLVHLTIAWAPPWLPEVFIWQ
jgi:parkin